MTEKKNIEKLFRDALGKAGAHPPKGTRESIEKKLIKSGFLKDNNSSKRFLFWIFGITGLAFLFIAIGYYTGNAPKNLSPMTTDSEQNNKPDAIAKKQEIKSTQMHELSTNSKSSPGSPESLNLSENGNKNPYDVHEHKGKREKENGLLSKKGNSSNASEEGIKAQQETGNDGSLTEDNFNSTSGKTGNRSGISYENAKQDFPAEKNQEEVSIKNQETESAHMPQDSVVINIHAGIENPQEQNIIGENNVIQNTDSSGKEEKKNDVLPDSLSKKKNKPGLSIDFFAAPQLSVFKDESVDEVYQAVVNEFNISEKEKISFSAGIGVNIPLKNFFVEPGINYSLIKSDFSYSKLQMTIDTSGSHYNYVDSTFYIYDTSGVPIDSFIVMDSSWITISKTSYLKTPGRASNKISVIEIPLWVGYKFSAGKFDIEAKIGTSVSFITSISTTMVTASSETVVLYNDRKNSPFRQSYLSFLAGANIMYNINQRFSIFLQPAFKYGLASIFKSDYPVSRKIQNYSVGAGLRVKF